MTKQATTKIFALSIILSSTNSYSTIKSICSARDSRVQEQALPIARMSARDNNRGCTATLIGKSCAITAGHCVKNLYRGEFNVPNSINGVPDQPSADDTYFVDQSSIVSQDEGRGNDWAIFKFKRNLKTNQFPGEVYGYYDIESYEPKKSDLLQIAGYGTHYESQELTYTLLKALGYADYIGYSDEGKTLLNHKIDTTSGSSGSAVINTLTNKIIGIHGQGGCRSSRLIWNSATLINTHKKIQAAIKNCFSF